MLNYLPLFMRKSKIYQVTFNAEELQFKRLYTDIQDLRNQLSIDTATWGLVFYENELKIPTDINKSFADRRAVIKSKLRGSGKVSALQIKLVADAYTNGNVEVSFNGHIVIKFTSFYGIPTNLDDLKMVLEDVKPAHLNITYEFSYLLINEIHGFKTLTEMETIPLNKFAGGV